MRASRTTIAYKVKCLTDSTRLVGVQLVITVSGLVNGDWSSHLIFQVTNLSSALFHHHTSRPLGSGMHGWTTRAQLLAATSQEIDTWR